MRPIVSKIANTILLIFGLLIFGLILIAFATTVLALGSREPDVRHNGAGLAVVFALGFWCVVGAFVNLRSDHLGWHLMAAFQLRAQADFGRGSGRLSCKSCRGPKPLSLER